MALASLLKINLKIDKKKSLKVFARTLNEENLVQSALLAYRNTNRAALNVVYAPLTIANTKTKVHKFTAP